MISATSGGIQPTASFFGFCVPRETGDGKRETGNGRFRIRTSGACCPNRSDAVPTLPRETRPPVLRAERRRPNAEGRKAKAGCPNGKGCVGSGAGRQAKARRVGSTQRRKEGRQAATHKESPCGVASSAAWREIRLPRPHSRGRHTGRRPQPFGRQARENLTSIRPSASPSADPPSCLPPSPRSLRARRPASYPCPPIRASPDRA